MKVRIPLAVCRNGEIISGTYSRQPNGKEYIDASTALDCLEESGYYSGYAVIHVEAELDIEALFKEHTLRGTVVTPEPDKEDHGKV